MPGRLRLNKQNRKQIFCNVCCCVKIIFVVKRASVLIGFGKGLFGIANLQGIIKTSSSE